MGFRAQANAIYNLAGAERLDELLIDASYIVAYLDYAAQEKFYLSPH